MQRIEQTSFHEEATQRWESKMIATTVNGLFNIMQPHFRNFPNDYVVIDVETTGTKFFKGDMPNFFPSSDLITQLGCCIVKDSKAIYQGSMVLDWFRNPGIDQQALKDRLAYTKQQVEFRDGQPTGKKYHMNAELMQKRGTDPLEALRLFKHNVFDVARQEGMFFVAHNGYHFDARMIENHYWHWLEEHIGFGPNEIFDTGMVEKGSQSNSSPWMGDTVKDWSYRTYKVRLKDVKWSLDSACASRYRLSDRHYLPVNLEGRLDEAHDAGFDCYVNHLLFEEYKEITAGRRPEPPIPYGSL
jgi:hypothetical protein